jgi:hypothetical protein
MTDLDPLLRDAMARVRAPIDAHPSLADVRRRARKRNHQRMAVTASALACTGVATAALIVRRDSTDSSTRGLASEPVDAADDAATSTVYLPGEGASTTTIYGAQTMTITASTVWDALWNARYDPSGVGLVVAPADQAAADVMPTPEQFGCTSAECSAMFNYVVWHEIAVELGFSDVRQMQGTNPGIDFSHLPREGDTLQSVVSSFAEPAVTSQVNETATTISLFDGIVLIDGGAPAGAMDDAFQRLTGYNRTIVPSSGKTVEQTELMPIGGNVALATAVGGLLGIDGFDTWDPSFTASPVEGMVAVVIGPDYFDRVPDAPTGTNTLAPTTTSIG